MINVHNNQRLHSHGLDPDPSMWTMRENMQRNIPKNNLAKQFNKEPEYYSGYSPTWTINPKNKKEIQALHKVIDAKRELINKDTNKPYTFPSYNYKIEEYPNKMTERDALHKKVNDLVDNIDNYRSQRDYKTGDSKFFSVGGKYRNEFIRRKNKYFQSDLTPQIYKESRFDITNSKLLPGKNIQWAFLNPDQGQIDYSKNYARRFRDLTGDEPVLMTGNINSKETFIPYSTERENERVIPYNNLRKKLINGEIKEEPFPWEKINNGEYKSTNI
jgi:hypothetical protein